jgi:PiT family inorganic phosphate transporter
MGVVLAFEAVNGWTDAPNAIATVVSTRVLSPAAAVAMAAAFNLLGALSGTAVATTIGKGIIDIDAVTLETVAASALAVVIWSSAAAYLGLPTSESHGLVAAIAGAGVGAAGTDVLLWDGWRKVFTGLGAAVTFGALGGLLLMLLLLWLLRNATPTFTRRLFGPLQLCSAAFMAWSHGTADGQKAMCVMAMALAIYYDRDFGVPCGSSCWRQRYGAEHSIWGWRIIRTLGCASPTCNPYTVFAQDCGTVTITVSSRFGFR